MYWYDGFSGQYWYPISFDISLVADTKIGTNLKHVSLVNNTAKQFLLHNENVAKLHFVKGIRMACGLHHVLKIHGFSTSMSRLDFRLWPQCQYEREEIIRSIAKRWSWFQAVSAELASLRPHRFFFHNPMDHTAHMLGKGILNIYIIIHSVNQKSTNWLMSFDEISWLLPWIYCRGPQLLKQSRLHFKHNWSCGADHSTQVIANIFRATERSISGPNKAHGQRVGDPGSTVLPVNYICSSKKV